MSHPLTLPAADIVVACRANASQAAAALGRALDAQLTLEPGEPAPFDAESPPAGFDGPGLLVLLRFGDSGLVAVLPQSCAVLPAWYAAPDASGAGKLRTLARELAPLLAPAERTADEFTAAKVDSIAAALARAGVQGDATHFPLRLTSGAGNGQLSLIWPLPAPSALFDAPTPRPATSHAGASPAKPSDFSQLPGYARSLLKVAVPVSVQLAAKRETVQEVVEIVPGSIIKFEKSCEQLLQMIVGGQHIAEGEAVKVGDKFGFRVTAMVLPSEHFVPLKRRPA